MGVRRAYEEVTPAVFFAPKGTMDNIASSPSRPRAPLGARVATLIAVVLPLAGLVAAVTMLWGVAFDWVHLCTLVGMYVLTVFGVTVGYHRLFTHKSFETPRIVAAFWGVLGSMAVHGSLMKWVALHRKHHQHSDDHDDPHSPHTSGSGFWGVLRGAWRSHMGWFFERDPEDLPKYVPDLASDSVVRWVSRLFPLWVAVGLLLPALIGGLVTMSWSGAILGFLWGGLARVFLVHHVTWSINSVCHLWGSKPFESHDESRNNALMAFLTFGEGWHNNHHAFPASARHGLRWWQFDPSYLVIRGMEMLGLAKRVRVPSLERQQARLRRGTERFDAP